ncbi:MAG: zincin-like metallopeptidase domain-containing protein [Christensenellales bacterium]
MADTKKFVEQKREEMLDRLIEAIENNPAMWEKGWYSMGAAPINASSKKPYRGLNAFFLSLTDAIKGYDDNRWVTFNQALKMGAPVKAGEKSSSVFFWTKYDFKTKKEFDVSVLADMEEEEKRDYLRENVRNVLKFYSVFNAKQCENFPEKVKQEMSEDERQKQNENIEKIIANSAAPIFYDGNGEAYYQPSSDTIHLPKIEDFKTKNNYYATALHEIGHSTGHESRLNRDFGGGFGSETYAIEELRAELACVFMQSDMNIDLSGAEVANHAAYLRSWLDVVKKDKDVFFKAAADADKIVKYISDNYLNKEVAKQDEEVTTQEKILEPNVSKWYQDNYPDDDMGKDINTAIVFDDILNRESEFSTIVGVSDSVIRERIFNELANRANVPYEEIYDRWLEPPQYVLDFELNHGSEMLLSNELKALGFEKDRSVYEENQALEIAAHNANATVWTEDIRYIGADGATIDGKVEVLSNAIITERGNMSDFVTSKIRRSDVEKIAEIIRGFGATVDVKTLDEKRAEQFAQLESVVAAEESSADNEKTQYVSPKEYYAAKNAKRLEQLQANVPDEMKNLPNWCAFKTYYDKSSGKKKKIILSPKTSEWASCSDPSTWGTWDEAMKFAKERNCEGLSFALDKKSRIVCIDLDHCIGDKGMRSELCWDILNSSSGTYAEKSVSGKGVHVFFKADDVVKGYSKKNDENGIECYDSSKFISMTGNLISKSNNLVDTPKKLIETARGKLGELPERAFAAQRSAGDIRVSMSDSELIDKIRESKVGAEFSRMFYNGENLCNDKHRTDAKLMSILAFFTDGNAGQMRSIFMSSSLYRADKGEKYLDRTVEYAISTLKTRPSNLGKVSKAKKPQGKAPSKASSQSGK